MTSVVKFANEILDMQAEIDYLRNRVARLENIERQYNELLSESIQHSSKMISGVMQIALTPGVMEALSQSKKD